MSNSIPKVSAKGVKVFLQIRLQLCHLILNEYLKNNIDNNDDKTLVEFSSFSSLPAQNTAFFCSARRSGKSNNRENGPDEPLARFGKTQCIKIDNYNNKNYIRKW